MDKNKDIDILYEWAVWAHLCSKKDLELILLKGHLMLEKALETTLSRNRIIDSDKFSFHRKLNILEKIITSNNLEEELILSSSRQINLMRNKLAHEFHYKQEDLEKDLEDWSSKILTNLRGMKFSKFTYRTKIIHSFSILTFNLLKIDSAIEILE